MRRPRGSGCRSTRPDGSHLLQWRERGKRESRVVRGISAAEADEMLDAIVLRVRELGGETLRDFAERWLDQQELRRRGDIAASRSRWRCHLEGARLADLELDQVRARDVRQWLDTLERAGVGQQQRRHCATLLSAMMRDALELELVDANPVRAVRLPPVPTSRRAIVLTAEEIEALRLLLDAGEHQVGAALALMLVGACLRPGELLGLRVEDLRGDHLLVQRSGRKRDATKTGHTMRRVEVFGWAELALERWQAIRPTLKIKRWKRTSPFLFPVPESYLRGAGAVGQALAAVGASRAHAHDLRGTGATHLLSGTYGPPWTIADVAALLGDSIATTERAYAHVTSGRQRELADGICLPTGPRNTYRANELETRARALRAWSDSNARPLASEARRGSLPGADLAAEVGHLVAVARRYVEAVAGGDRFSHERGLDLAEAVLRAHVRAEASA